MRKLSVEGDGLCFFRAVAQGISHVDHGIKLSKTQETYDARYLREACNAFLYHHPGLIVHSQDYLENKRHFTSNGLRKIDVAGRRPFDVGQRRSNAPRHIIRSANERIGRTHWQHGPYVQWADELDTAILSFILSREIKIFEDHGSSTRSVIPVFPTQFTNKPIAVFYRPEIHYDAYVPSPEKKGNATLF
jgi:hypothetical protein